MKKQFFFLYFVLTSVILMAQQEKDTVKTQVINVTRSFEPKVQDAFKLNVNPDIDKLPEEKIPVEISIRSVPVAPTFTPEKGGMAHFNIRNMTENVYQSFVSFSAGNYTQIKSEAYLFYPVSDRLGAALNLSHYSSQGGVGAGGLKFEPFYHTFLNFLFDYKTDESTWNFDLGYKGHINYLKKDLNSTLVTTPVVLTNNHKENNFVFDLKGTFNDNFIKDLNFEYNNYWDEFTNTEHEVQLSSNFVVPIDEFDLKTRLQTGLVTGDLGKLNFVENYADKNITYKNINFGISPSVQINNDRLIVNAGVKIFYQNNDTLFKKIQFLPNFKTSLNLIYEKLTVFAGVTGDLIQNSHSELSYLNPYLRTENIILPSLMPYDLYGGFNGALTSVFSYEVKMGYRQVKNYPFYNYDNINMFIGYGIIYDDLSQSYFDTALNIGVGKRIDVKLHLTYMQNKAQNTSKVLFLPDFSFKSILIFNPTDRLSFNATIHSLGNRNFSQNVAGYISGYNDMNIGVRYNINKQFTAFLQANNLLSKTYEIYYGYPVQKLQILAGASYRFDLLK